MKKTTLLRLGTRGFLLSKLYFVCQYLGLTWNCSIVVLSHHMNTPTTVIYGGGHGLNKIHKASKWHENDFALALVRSSSIVPFALDTPTWWRLCDNLIIWLGQNSLAC